jgi:site-specific DNA-adenine methylase
LKQDIVFFDPPWGGRGYKKIKHLNLKLSDTDLAEIVNKLVGRAQMVALKVPVNFNIQDFYNKIKSNRVDMYKISSKKKVKIYQKKDDRTRAYSKEKVKMHLLIIHLTDL